MSGCPFMPIEDFIMFIVTQSVNGTTGRHTESYWSELPLVAVLFISINNNIEFCTGWQSILIAIPYLSPEQPVGISVSCHRHRWLLLPSPNHQQRTFLSEIHGNDATYSSSKHWIAIIAFRQVLYGSTLSGYSLNKTVKQYKYRINVDQ